jgi:hypothetical protein
MEDYDFRVERRARHKWDISIIICFIGLCMKEASDKLSQAQLICFDSKVLD